MSAAQIALPLEPAPSSGPSRIVVGNANAAVAEAFGAIDSWPFGTAIIFGPARSGKSLMARWFAGEGLGEAIDDADQRDETEIFHAWNRAREAQRPLLLTATLTDGGWQVKLPDLASRLNAALRLDIGEPDDEMFAELVAAHAEARSLALSEEGARYLATRAERSHMGAERLVTIIDRLSLERKAAPGLAIWREALEEISGGEG